MGAIPYDGGTTFRVWAPHAQRVQVVGEFSNWHAVELARELSTENSPAFVNGLLARLLELKPTLTL